MKNITLIHFAYPPNTGGVEIMVRQHALILAQFGFKVQVLTGSGHENDQRIKLIEVPQFQSVLSFNPPLQEKILTKGIIDEEFYKTAKIIEGHLEKLLINQDVVIVHNILTIVRNLPFIQAFKNYAEKHPEKKYFAWTHDHSYINESQIKDVKKNSFSQVERDLLTTPIPNVKYILISESIKKPLLELMKLSSKNTVVIPNGIDIKNFLEISDRIWMVVEKCNLLSSFPVILCPANIIGRKNLEYAIKIAAQMKKTYKNIKFLVTGNPSSHRSTLEYFNFLKTLIFSLSFEDNVIFLNKYIPTSLEEEEIHDLYDLTDIVFYFSKSENFGLPLLEAGLSKIPLFVSNLPVFKEILGNNLHIIDYKNTTPESAAVSIISYLEKDTRIKNHYTVRTKYDLTSIIRSKLIPLF